MKHLSSWFAVAILMAIVLVAYPVDAQVKIGDMVLAEVPYCKSLRSAMVVANVDGRLGPEAAVAMLQKLDDCAVGRGVVKFVKIMHSVKTARGTTYVIQVEVGGNTFYVLTDVEVK